LYTKILRVIVFLLIVRTEVLHINNAEMRLASRMWFCIADSQTSQKMGIS
jgi:hypothetical protein